MSGSFELPPPGEALEVLLGQLTPPGALTWRCLPGELPWTRPQSRRGRRPSARKLDEVLKDAGVTTKAARDYVLSGPFTEVMVYSPRELDRNHGRAARAIEVAAERDIIGTELTDIASRLDLSDHLVPTPGRTDALLEGDPRGARRYLKRGRELLGALGVLPCVHIENWQRLRKWWQDPDVIHALLGWHDKAWMADAHRLAFVARARFGRQGHHVIRVDEHRACTTFRDQLTRLPPLAR